MARSNESPMDFTWDNKSGPLDPTSPFSKLATMKRSHSIFDSPEKNSVPSLREPNSQPFLFSPPPQFTSEPAPAPAPAPYRAPSFTTPRKPFDVDISSGPENFSSPEQADNEDTPEAPRATADFIGKDSKPGTKRNSLFNFYGRFAPSPGRGDGSRLKYSDAIARRVHKKRRRAQKFENQVALARRLSEDTSDEDIPGPTNPNAHPPQQMGRLASLFSFIEQYPNAPSLITKYFQTLANAAILTFAFYIIYSVWSTIRADVDRASEDSAAEILAEMAACAKNYVDNRCGGTSRLPALETVCDNWELCMNRDPNSVRRAQVSAHTFAQIINGFVEPISLKTMLFFGLTIVLSLVITNTTAGFIRRSQDVHAHPAPLHPSGSYTHQVPPQTPGVVHHYTATPSIGYGVQGYGQQQQIGWSTSNNSMWNGGERSIDYEGNLAKRQRARSRSPEKLRHGSR